MSPQWSEGGVSVCHVILHLGVTSVKRRGRRLRTVGGLWQSVNTVSVLCSCITDTYISPVTRELDPMFVNLNTETRNLHSLSLSSLPVGIAILITQTTNLFLAFCCFFQISPCRRYSKHCRVLVICVQNTGGHIEVDTVLVYCVLYICV